MKPRAFADGIPQSNVFDHLSFHYGQCILLLHLGYRDGNDLDAAMVLGLYIQEQVVTWRRQRIDAKRLAARARRADECHGASL